MKLQYISNEKYNDLLFKGIVGGSGFSREVKISDSGYPCIGYNFNLKEPIVARKVLAAVGFDVDCRLLSGDALVAEKYYINLIVSAFNIVSCRDAVSLRRIINNIILTRKSDPRYQEYPEFKRVEQFVYEEEHNLISSLSSVISYYESILDHWLMSFNTADKRMNAQLLLKSKERAVLFSLIFQGLIGMEADQSTPKFQALGAALASNNRAQCWYIIRYDAFINNKLDVDVAKRRYFESELFGLYDAGTKASTLSSHQCKEIYKMFNDNKQQILEHETEYASAIQSASSQYGVDAGLKIKTLEQSFEMVYTHIREMKALNSAMLLQKQLAQTKIPTLRPIKNIPMAS